MSNQKKEMSLNIIIICLFVKFSSLCDLECWLKEYTEKWERDERFEKENKLAWESGDLDKIKELYEKGTPVGYWDMDLAKGHPHVCVWLASMGIPFYWYGDHYYLLPNGDTGELEVVEVAWSGKHLVVVEVYDRTEPDYRNVDFVYNDAWYEYSRKVHNFKD